MALAAKESGGRLARNVNVAAKMTYQCQCGVSMKSAKINIEYQNIQLISNRLMSVVIQCENGYLA